MKPMLTYGQLICNKWAKNIQWGKDKIPEKQLSDLEILRLQEKDFRLLLKMMQDTVNKLEAKIDNL